MGQTTIERDRPPPLSAHGDAALVRAIGLGGATLLVIGNVIGLAIFLTSGTMAAELGSASALVAVWVAGGLLSLAGGLTFAEMGAMFPRSGGLYVFLDEAYGPLPAFLFGWAGLLITLTGSCSAVAVGFAEYFSYFVPSLGRERYFSASRPRTSRLRRRASSPRPRWRLPRRSTMSASRRRPGCKAD